MNFHRALRVHQNVEKVLSPALFVLLLVCIPAYEGFKLEDYDLVIGNWNNLMFFKDRVNESINLPVTERSKDIKIRIVAVVPDLQTNGIYFSILTKNSSSISIFYPEANNTVHIYSSSRGSIGSINLHKDYLYWCNESSKSVMRLAVSNWTDSSIKKVPEVVFEDRNGTFESMTIHPKTSVIFYTMWRRSNESKIFSFDPASQTFRTVVEDVFQPKGLFIDIQNNLYWIDNPPGIYFHIERISLDDNLKRELIIRDQNQHPYSITVLCSKMYWTDLMNKVLWEFDMNNKTYLLLKYFDTVTPYGLSLTRPHSPAECENKITQIQSTTILPTTVNPKDCVGIKCWKQDPKSEDSKDMSNTNSQGRDAQLCSVSEEPHCFNGASCIKINSQVFCICASGFGGPTCAEKIESEPCNLVISSWSSNPPLFISVIVFSIVILLLLIIMGLLIRKIRKQDRRPKIRRRVVVAHRSDADNSGSSTVCEMIDIENCCNMNICETPCYERLGSFSAGSSSAVTNSRTRKPSVKEDKKCLLSS